MPLASSPEYVKQINSVNYVDGTLSARKSFGAKAVFFVAFPSASCLERPAS
jgi:hypothetical protein